MTFLNHAKYRYLSACNHALQDSDVGDFRAFIRRSVTKYRPAIEVGPSHAPIIAKRDGYAVRIIDHATRDELVEKYKNDVSDLSAIEEVDVVWTGQDLTSILPRAATVAIVASHFIEHAPNFLGFLRQCSELLTEDGEIYLCVPDRHYCFDAFHSSTSTGKIIEDNILGRTRHSFQSFYEVSSQLRANSDIAWTQSPITKIEFITGLPPEWINTVDQFVKSETYVDNHENYFSPSSFSLIIEELHYLGQLDLGLKLITRSRGSEFLAVLSKRPFSSRNSKNDFERLALSLRLNMLREDAEQAEMLQSVFEEYGL